MVFGGTMDAIGALARITRVLLSLATTIFGLFVSTVFSCIGLNVIASDQYLAIVIPGKTPCLNCLDLWRSEQFPHHNSFEILAALDSGEGKGLELPAAQVALLTGLITTQVIQYCTSVGIQNVVNSEDAAKLVGATLAINLFDPLNSISLDDETFGYRYWQPHTSCGCQRLI